MYFHRKLEKALTRYLKFPVIAILGQRYSGKTTLARTSFADYAFVSLEDPSLREFAQSDPKGFLQEYSKGKGLIIDEFQYVPDLLSYIQLIIDEKKRPAYFILTGSQNFLMNQAITQSLAGRVGILTLLPLSIDELNESKLLAGDVNELILNGSYPRLYADKIPPTDLYPSYINTYIERDVRQLTNVGDLAIFQKFLALCAGRIGQLLNLSELAMHCSISVPTATKWLSILEASYILFRLQPHFNNFNKRITKTPKLFFYDTGIACSLLKITSVETLAVSPFKGNLFENLIIADFFKQFYNKGIQPGLYFWRDRNGIIEVDTIVDNGKQLTPVEIKSSQTINIAFFDALTRWNEISDTSPKNNYLIYGGTENQKRVKGSIVSWRSAGTLISKILGD